jgi:hypothetical protein
MHLALDALAGGSDEDEYDGVVRYSFHGR